MKGILIIYNHSQHEKVCKGVSVTRREIVKRVSVLPQINQNILHLPTPNELGISRLTRSVS